MKPRFQWRHQYDNDADDKMGRETTTLFTEPSLTQQQFKDEVDLNVMMARMGVTDGAIPLEASDPSYYGDFSDAVDFRDAIERVRHAQQAFDELPAKLRDRFANDPTRLWNFVNDPENLDEAISLGLLHKSVAAPIPAPKPTPEPQPKGELPPANKDT